jgi:hypothetical protein
MGVSALESVYLSCVVDLCLAAWAGKLAHATISGATLLAHGRDPQEQALAVLFAGSLAGQVSLDDGDGVAAEVGRRWRALAEGERDAWRARAGLGAWGDMPPLTGAQKGGGERGKRPLGGGGFALYCGKLSRREEGRAPSLGSFWGLKSQPGVGMEGWKALSVQERLEWHLLAAAPVDRVD